MILVTGATGFIGSHIVRALRQDGLAVRALVRSPDKAKDLAALGVDIARGDINDAVSVERAFQGVERVIHLVGIIQEGPGFTFRSIHVEGTRTVVTQAKKAGATQILYQSALGSRQHAASEYHKTKWEAEELVRMSGVPHTILRPSLIYGPGDQFTIRLSEMIKLSPFLPVIGSGKSKVQPLYIDDLIACIRKAAREEGFLNKVFELGGPEQLTYEEVTKAIAGALGVKRPMVHMPLLFIKTAAKVMETVLPKPPVTTDQLIMLQEDNVCDLRDIREVFGVQPVAFQEGLGRFLGSRSG